MTAKVTGLKNVGLKLIWPLARCVYESKPEMTRIPTVRPLSLSYIRWIGIQFQVQETSHPCRRHRFEKGQSNDMVKKTLTSKRRRKINALRGLKKLAILFFWTLPQDHMSHHAWLSIFPTKCRQAAIWQTKPMHFFPVVTPKKLFNVAKTIVN